MCGPEIQAVQEKGKKAVVTKPNTSSHTDIVMSAGLGGPTNRASMNPVTRIVSYETQGFVPTAAQKKELDAFYAERTSSVKNFIGYLRSEGKHVFDVLDRLVKGGNAQIKVRQAITEYRSAGSGSAVSDVSYRGQIIAAGLAAVVAFDERMTLAGIKNPDITEDVVESLVDDIKAAIAGATSKVSTPWDTLIDKFEAIFAVPSNRNEYWENVPLD